MQTELKRLIETALSEDIRTGDITSELLIPADLQGEILFVARKEMVACGGFVPEMVFAALKADVAVTVLAKEGQGLVKGDVIAKAKGQARALLTGERVTLNIMQRMCGVATMTREFVDAVKGTKAVILDTRKTIPGFRLLDKYAVKTGGGENNRIGLWDMVFIKDNHIALCGGVSAAIQKAKDGIRKGEKIVVECDTLAQLKDALAAKPDRILLDNMSLEMMREAVAMSAGKIPLEASGGVSLETVCGIAETGVDFISVGKITHSAPSVDIGADIKIQG